MRNRIFNVLLLLASLTPASVYALGLGELNLQSYLSQPLTAEIALVGVEPGDAELLEARLASSESHQKAGLERPFSLSALKFVVQERAGGNPYIRVSTATPVKEPFFDFLLELSAPDGRVFRQYTLLLDPPPSPAAPKVASAEVEVPQVVRKETTDAGMKMPAGSAGQDGEYGPTEIGDTLWEIALQVRPQGVSVNQAMIAIVEANPDAFINANVNQMLAGKVLALPSEEAYLALDNRQASAEFARQQQAWKDYKASAPQVAPPVVAQSEAGQVVRAVESHDQQQVAATATQGRVRLLAPADGGAGEGSAGSTTRAGSADEVSAHIQLLEENLDVQERENQALLEQISDLEKQLATLRSMLDVADTMASGAPVESADPTPAESAVKVEDPAVEPGDKQVGADEQPAGEASTDVPPVEGEEGSAADSIPTESGGTLSSEDPATGGEEGSAVAEPAEADEPAKVAADERPRPRPVAPTAPSAGSSWVDMVMDNLIYLAGLVLLVVLAVVGLAIRGGRKDKPSKESDIAFGDDDATLVRTPGDSDDSEAAEVETAVSEKDQFTQTVNIEADGAGAAQPSEDTESFLDDFGGPGLGVSAEAELEDVDPIAEADVFLAYGHHEQAEEIILDAIQFDDRTTLKLKLLDIYFGQEKAEEYEQYAGEIRASVDDGTWERVAALGLALNPGSELFVGCTLDANEVGSLVEASSVEDELDLSGEMDAGEAEELSAAVDSFDLDDFGEDDDDSSAELSDSLDMDAPAESEEPASEVIEPSSSELSTSINLDAFTTEQPAVGDGETAAEVEENSGDAGGLDEENSLSLDFDATSLPDTDEGETEKSEVNDEIDGLDFESGVSDESTDDDADDAQGETSDPVYEDTEVLDFETDTAPDADAEVDEPEKAIEFDETEILDFETDLDPLESASDDAPAPAEADNASIDDDEGLDATVEFDLDDDLGDGPAATDSVDAEETEELSIEFDAGDSPEVDSDSGDTTAAEQAEEVSAEFDGIELDMDDGEASSVEDSSVGLDETIISFPSDDASEGELDTVQNLDAVASQLDLLAAYVDMDDRDQAAALNEKIQAHGNDEQKQQAEELMKQLSS